MSFSLCKNSSFLPYILIVLLILVSDKYTSQYGGQANPYSYYHDEDESTFQLVDTSRVQRPIYQKGRLRFTQVEHFPISKTFNYILVLVCNNLVLLALLITFKYVFLYVVFMPGLRCIEPNKKFELNFYVFSPNVLLYNK